MRECSKLTRWFENYVNYAGSKTTPFEIMSMPVFENYVNYAGSKTFPKPSISNLGFENYVNYAGSKTETMRDKQDGRLRTM